MKPIKYEIWKQGQHKAWTHTIDSVSLDVRASIHNEIKMNVWFLISRQIIRRINETIYEST